MMKLNSAYKYLLIILFTAVSLTSGLLYPMDSIAQLVDPGGDTGGRASGDAPPSGVPIPGIAAEFPDIDLEQCAYDLTNYMNTVLENVDPSGPSILTSIAFNLTSPLERPLFQMMEAYDANFDMLEYFSGNTYTLRKDGVTLAYDFYIDQGWKADFEGKYGKEMIFTEYGDFAKHPEHGGASSYESFIGSMQAEFGRAIGSGNKVIYFAPFPGNPEFDFHNFDSDDQFQRVVAANPSAAGANSAQEIDYGGGFPTKVAGLGMRYVLEIITGPNSASVIDYINGLPDGMIPVIRSCWGNSCDMEDPLVLADFINTVDAGVDRPWHVLVGPNEPLTDPWVSPACGTGDEDREWEWEHIKCENTTDPEFHSLRPYPASPCSDPDDNLSSQILMCGNSLTVEERFSFTIDQVDTSTECEALPVRTEYPPYTDIFGNTILYDKVLLQDYNCEGINLTSSAAINLDFSESELPVLGNTEDVPNAQSGANSLSFDQRMSNYVSWYLQGAVPTAEEEFAGGSSEEGQRKIINFSGPIQKLVPWQVANGEFEGRHTVRYEGEGFFGTTYNPSSIRGSDKGRLIERIRQIFTGGPDIDDPRWYSLPAPALSLTAGDQRHDQIVACGGGYPEACYTQQNQTRSRVSEVRNSNSLKHPYIPLSSTEDAMADIRAEKTQYGQPPSDIVGFVPPTETTEGWPDNPYYIAEDPNSDETPRIKNYDVLFYAHARETNQLAKLLQSTYIPEGQFSNSTSNMPPFEPTNRELQSVPYCTVVDTYTNPGDNLYGNATLGDGTQPETAPVNQFAIGCIDLDGNPIPGADPENCNDDLGRDARNINAQVRYEALVECQFTESFNQAGFTECASSTITTREGCTTAQFCIDRNGVEDPDQNPRCEAEIGGVYCIYESRAAGEPPAQCAEDNTSYNGCETMARTAFDITTESPYLEELFNRLVYGNMSFFRRIFPRLRANNQNLAPEIANMVVPGPEDLIQNIPGMTNVSFGSSNISSNADYIGGQTLAGDPAENNPGSSAEIYFPYLGSIHKYFLQDTLCSFYPAGVGCDNTTFVEEVDNSSIVEANCKDVADSEIPGRYLGGYKSNFIRIAEAWTAKGESQASRCYNDTVKRSLEAGVSPAFVLAIWAHESAASNYTASDKCWEDFGMHTTAQCQDFDSQITSFLRLWDDNSYQSRYPHCFSNEVKASNPNLNNDLQIAMDIFWYGARNCLDRENEIHTQYEMSEHEYYWQRISPWFSEISGCSFNSLTYPPGGSC